MPDTHPQGQASFHKSAKAFHYTAPPARRIASCHCYAPWNTRQRSPRTCPPGSYEQNPPVPPIHAPIPYPIRPSKSGGTLETTVGYEKARKAVQAHNSLEPGKALGTLPASATKAEWDAEIYAIISAIETINNLVGTSGAISMDDKLAELVQTDSDAVKEFLHLVNSSTILREMLPQMMYDSLEKALTVALTPLYGANAGAHAATIMDTTSNTTIVWIRGQLGDSKPTASVAEWDAQIDTVCAILADPSVL